MDADLDALEFGAIRRLLERLTATPYGADAARALIPAPDIAAAAALQRAVSAARRAIEQGVAGLGRLPDIRAALRQAAQGGAALSGMALAHVAQLLHAAKTMRALHAGYPDLYPDEAALGGAPALSARLDTAVTASGRIIETASPRLALLAGEQSRGRAQVEALLKARLTALGITDAPGEAIVASGARLVLALAPEIAGTIKGVRRGPSGHGHRYLVEPLEAVAANNHLEASAGQRDAEEGVVRRQLTAEVASARDLLEALLGAIAWIDLAFAGGHLSIHMNAHAPQLVPEPLLRLAGVYHPALLLAFADRRGPRPVPLSIALDPSHPMLLVTGPNTGGKTVVLKTVGLLLAMAHCGLHIPGEGQAVVGSFRRLIVDIGDRQSLLHQLSTFAGHVEVLKRLLNEADGQTLVLMDELGTGTDPEEGAALAMAVLDELARRRVRGIITTHLSPLKSYAAAHPYLTNATMRFDEERLVPTYELVVGESGASHGLTIAARGGLAPALIQAARAHLAATRAGRPDPS
ncbi:hypothetical protein [Acidiferrobacter sp.]|uniref:endonuclease MutS2 n=1 Tax=Acidiferrobacter sp. TaxID=1872107 RepID=UPI0026217281|nr:hypothetical protein [Acidiferrobacter sp.]